ncbi:hypothetical protein [Treponema sp.]|uniref:hypothetical protein n=1 Tax=Treponema sp. TaxID=166 RepID=UPI003F0530AA
MLNKIFRTLLLLCVLGLGVLFFLDFFKEKNILHAVLIGFVCLFTIINIIRIFSDYFGVYTEKSVLLILGTLYFLVEDGRFVLILMIILQLVESISNDDSYESFMHFLGFIVCYGSLIACIFKIFDIGIFGPINIGILITCCIPLVVLFLFIIGSSFNMLDHSDLYQVESIIIIISCITQILLSILLKTMGNDISFGNSLFFGVMAVLAMIGRLLCIKN